MDISNITAALLELQDYDADTFFYTLYQCIDLTPLTNAAAGPGSRGPNLKDIDLSAGLFLWYCWLWVVRSDNPPNPTTLRRELEDPESNLAKLNRVDEGRKLSVRRTLANHFERFGQHPDLVVALLLEINQRLPPASPDAQSPNQKKPAKKPGRPSPDPKSPELEKEEKAKKAEREPGRQKESKSKNRNQESIAYHRDRGQEALGKREFDPIVKNEASAQAFALQPIHGDHPNCHRCPEKNARGWNCVKDHSHGVVVEVQRMQGQARQWKCHCCESKLTVTSGTIFHATNFTCVEILLALYKIVSSRFGVSSQDIAGYLNEAGRDVSKGAAFMLMHRLRECMWEDEPGRFTGETEIDEMLLHLECGKRVSLMVAYNRPTRRIRFKIVERRSKKKPKANKREMLKFICEVTVPGSTILSDGDAAMPTPEQMRRTLGVICHNSRKGSRKGSQGRKFLTYMLLHGEFAKHTEVTTNRVEAKNSVVRRSFRLRNGITRHHLDRYLMELAWRINHQHNRLESQNYDGRERRELSLMRNVLAGASRRKMILGDLRGKPQEKRDRTRDKNRTAPVSDPAEPQQRPLLPPGPIVPGASQSGSGQVEVKPHQTRPTPQSEGGQVEAKLHQTRPTAQSGSGKVEVKPPQTRPMQMVMTLWNSQPEDEQPQPVLPEETAVGSQPAESGPLEELEWALAA